MRTKPRPTLVVYLARLVWVGAGAACAIGLALNVISMATSPLLLASLGGSTLFLFGLTKLPATQPRALFGGHLIAATIGVICNQFFGTGISSCMISVSLTIMVLLLTRTVHPPAAANSLLMIRESSDWITIFDTVFAGVFSLAFVAFVWSRLIGGKITYPVKWMTPSPRTHRWGIWG